MIIVYVKHYLNADGKRFFDRQWFPEVNRLIRQQRGFIAIESYQDKLDYDCIHITVKFISKETLDAWVATEDHARVINQLDCYRTRPWHFVITENENATLDSLQWNQVPLDKSPI